METRKIIKTIVSLTILLTVLQLLRIAIGQTIFVFIKRTPFTDDIVSIVTMLILTIVFIIYSSVKRVPLSVFPQKFHSIYIIETLVLAGLLISTPIITGDHTPQSITMMIYSSIMTPVFEEVIFRGYLWNKLNGVLKKEAITYLTVTLLFAIWHIGYIERIASHVSGGLAVIMIWKVVIGFCFGVVLGAVRLKMKNCYATILLHGIMNVFGR